MDKDRIINIGKRVLTYEGEALIRTASKLNNNGFVEAIDLILNCSGHVVICGVGKSGHIGKKMAASLASTGTPSFFIHPAEAKHGDLGMITEEDVIMLISYSGETEEVISLIPYINYKNVKTISITGNPNSKLAKHTSLHISLNVDKEACPYNLAPTVSTSVTLGIGDALAITLMELKNFTKDDFSKNHPAGRLGKLLITKIGDIMKKDDNIPSVFPDCTLRNTIEVVTQKRLGFAVVVNSDLIPEGVFTDGDLRRALVKCKNINNIKIRDIMTKTPTTISPNTLVVDVVKCLQENRITSLLVVDDNNKLIGVTHMHDLIEMGFTNA